MLPRLLEITDFNFVRQIDIVKEGVARKINSKMCNSYAKIMYWVCIYIYKIT